MRYRIETNGNKFRIRYSHLGIFWCFLYENCGEFADIQYFANLRTARYRVHQLKHPNVWKIVRDCQGDIT